MLIEVLVGCIEVLEEKCTYAIREMSVSVSEVNYADSQVNLVCLIHFLCQFNCGCLIAKDVLRNNAGSVFSTRQHHPAFFNSVTDRLACKQH